MFGRPEALSDVFHELSARPFANLGEVFSNLDERTSPALSEVYIEH